MSILNYFKQRQEDNDNFFFAVDLGNDGTLRNVFWVNKRPRCGYLQLYDIVVFDVTYKANNFKMSFARFIGVNQHFSLFCPKMLIGRRNDRDVRLAVLLISKMYVQ